LPAQLSLRGRYLIDIISNLAGTFLVVLGIALLITTLRAATSGNHAYQANRRLTPMNPAYACAGALHVTADVRERRTQSGMAVEIKTGQLRRQEKLSAEAIDEVIGRQL